MGTTPKIDREVIDRKDIPGYEGLYQIDSLGKVFSLDRKTINSLGRSYAVPGKQRKPIDHCTGYATVTLSKTGVSKTHRIHRLVAEVFLPVTDPSKKFVNHKNGNKRDNRVSNLEWCSPQENTDHAIAAGLFKVKGLDNPASKLTTSILEQSLDMLSQGKTLKEVSAAFGVNRNSIPRALDREFGVRWRDILKPQYRKD